MEKLAYVLWKPEAQSSQAFRAQLVDEVAPQLRAAGAANVQISAVDDAVAAGEKLRLDGGVDAKDAFATFWLEQSQEAGDCQALLASVSSQLAGFLVVESRPLPNPHLKPGARTPGFSLCTCIVKRGDIERERFIELWYDVHRDVAIDTQSTFSYVRNEIVRALTPGAPDWDAIVEEGFPIEALDDPRAFYDAVGDEARFEDHLRQMIESCEAFIDLERVSSQPMSQYS
ncbi:MAG: EthD domain-containing protein [Myxococcota bacterium]|nr:EthD domain-containing protein [Myxococcota bacterium]